MSEQNTQKEAVVQQQQAAVQARNLNAELQAWDGSTSGRPTVC